MPSGTNSDALRSLQDFLPAQRRDTAAYRAFKRSIIAARPICEHCNVNPSRIVAHKVQPILGGALLHGANVLALCDGCDQDYNRTNPVVRRRPSTRS